MTRLRIDAPTVTLDEAVSGTQGTGSQVGSGELAPGTELGGKRFVISRRVGEGGMGVVYEAFDRRAGTPVALKTLPRSDAVGISRLKQEFRSLADVVHPGLVGLHELFVDGELWFFTMDLVEGVPFNDHVRDESSLPFDRTVVTLEGYGPLSRKPLPAGAAPLYRIGELRDALRSLALGISAIHAAGKLHRDLKPSNVLVRKDGSVVVLDFGLVGELHRDGATAGRDQSGTPAYMAPEQARGERLTRAADWYSFGVILYEALTGRVPYEGDLYEILLEKQYATPEAPSRLVAGVPEDLERLCLDLLKLSAEERPSGSEVLARLSVESAARAPSAPPLPDEAFLGRAAELRVLESALADVRAGSSVTLLVHGLSGMGKTALVEHFLRERVPEGAIVLAGRCFEREAVPFKALDGIVDELVRLLSPDDPACAALPSSPGAEALVRLFPVLRRISVPSPAGPENAEISEPLELRRLAFAALRDLLSRLALDRTLIVLVDDLQWGDVDSAQLLADILDPENAPPALFVFTYRSDEVERSPCLSALLRGDRDRWKERAREVSLGPLSAEEGRELARALLGASEAREVESFAAEASGNPYFMVELSRHARRARTGDRGALATLDEAIVARTRYLPDRARRLLDIVAVAGRPLHLPVALAAADLAGAQRDLLVTLVTSHLVRPTTLLGEPALIAYHDRVREAISRTISGEALRLVHEGIVRALRAAGTSNPEMLVEHLAGAGDVEAALEHALAAAGEAGRALAYETEANLYRRAISWVKDEVMARDLRVRLARALRNAGRAAEAGWAYLEAADGAEPAELSELREQAADNLVLAGHLNEGIQILEGALKELGLELPDAAAQGGVDPSFLALFGQILQRGLDFEPTAEDRIPADVRRRIDLFWSVGWGLHMSSLRGRPFLLRHLLSALDAGEPYRVVRGLCLYVQTLSALRSPGAEAALRAVDRAAEQTNDPRAPFWREYAHMTFHRYNGRAAAACVHGPLAEKALQALPFGASRELGSLRSARASHIFSAGHYTEFIRKIPEWLADAQQRNDLFTVVWMHGYASQRALLLDDPVSALESIRTGLARWRAPEAGDVQHILASVQEAAVHLYTGDLHELGRLLSALVLPAHLSSIPFFAALSVTLRGRAHLMLAASDEAGREEHLRAALDAADEIERLDLATDAPCAPAFRAGAAYLRGDVDAARAHLDEAARLAGDAEAAALAAPIARRRAVISKSPSAQLAAIDSRMRAEGIRNPGRWAAMFVPGFD